MIRLDKVDFASEDEVISGVVSQGEDPTFISIQVECGSLNNQETTIIVAEGEGTRSNNETSIISISKQKVVCAEMFVVGGADCACSFQRSSGLM